MRDIVNVKDDDNYSNTGHLTLVYAVLHKVATNQTVQITNQLAFMFASDQRE